MNHLDRTLPPWLVVVVLVAISWVVTLWVWWRGAPWRLARRAVRERLALLLAQARQRGVVL